MLSVVPLVVSVFRLFLSENGNGIFGIIGHTASEEVILELIRTKCIPILLYGLEVLPL